MVQRTCGLSNSPTPAGEAGALVRRGLLTCRFARATVRSCKIGLAVNTVVMPNIEDAITEEAASGFFSGGGLAGM